MAFYGKNVFTVVELGTSKICVLHGTCDKAGNAELLGIGQRPSEGAIVKGTITDYNCVLKNLEAALEDADKSANTVAGRGKVYFLMSGSSLTSRQGEGNVIIYDTDHRVKSSHMAEAIKKAQNISISPDQENFGIFGSYFTINSTHRIKNPLDQHAETLNAYVHLISGSRKLINTYLGLVSELGFERGAIPVFSGVASAYGTLSSDEREYGTLLVDFGAGVCDYLVVHNDGILLSGVLPIGVDNLANDLSIGLDLSMDYCRKFLRDNTLEGLRERAQSIVEIPGITADKTRKIPLLSFEKIIDMRLRELFTIIKEQVDGAQLAHLLRAGTVLCGGGAMIPSAMEIMHNVMGNHVRRAEPFGISGAMTGVDRSPAHASVLGLLKYAAELESGTQQGSLNQLGDVLESLTGRLEKGYENFKKAFKL